MLSKLTAKSAIFKSLVYRIAQNSGGAKLWRISNYKVLARKTLANL